MRTLNALARELAGAAVTLLIASFVIFGAMYITPGSAVNTILGGSRDVTPERIAAIEAEYHLDEGFLHQYLRWLGGVLHGDFGQSFVYHEPVAGLIVDRLAVTAQLVAFASLLILVIGIRLGVLAGLRPKRTGTVVLAGTSVAMSIPAFVMAVILIAVFANNLGWFPALGEGHGFADRVWHLTLPAIALALSGLAYVTQVTTGAIRAELRREHVQTATVRGLPRRLVIRRHVFRNALLPISTVGGLTVAGLFATAAVVETAFGLHGAGAYLIEAIQRKDYAIVQGLALTLVAIFLVVNALVDLLNKTVDPRVGRKVVAG